MHTRSKKFGKRGFTLAELLVVVAIIAILIFVSIPIFTSQLEKSREATDIANMRAAKAAAVTAYLSDESGDFTVGTATPVTWTGFYDAQDGKIVKTKPSAGYGQGTATDGKTAAFMGYTTATDAKGKVIEVVLDTSTQKVTIDWVAAQ